MKTCRSFLCGPPPYPGPVIPLSCPSISLSSQLLVLFGPWWLFHEDSQALGLLQVTFKCSLFVDRIAQQSRHRLYTSERVYLTQAPRVKQLQELRVQHTRPRTALKCTSESVNVVWHMHHTGHLNAKASLLHLLHPPLLSSALLFPKQQSSHFNLCTLIPSYICLGPPGLNSTRAQTRNFKHCIQLTLTQIFLNISWIVYLCLACNVVIFLLKKMYVTSTINNIKDK